MKILNINKSLDFVLTLHEIVKNIFLIFKHLLFKKKMDIAILPYLVNWKK